MRSSTETLIDALKILAHDIQSEDGIANAAIFEAAGRMEELKRDSDLIKKVLDKGLIKCFIWDDESQSMVEAEIGDKKQLEDLLYD